MASISTASLTLGAIPIRIITEHGQARLCRPMVILLGAGRG